MLFEFHKKQKRNEKKVPLGVRKYVITGVIIIMLILMIIIMVMTLKWCGQNVTRIMVLMLL